MRIVTSFALAVVFSSLAHAATPHDRIAAALGTERFGLTELGPTAPMAGASFDLVLPGPDGDVALALAPHSVRSPKFRVLTVGEGGVEEVAAPPVRTYRGVAYSPGSPVPAATAASITDAGVTALILLEDGTARVVQPASDLIDGAPSGLHVVYDAKDAVTPDLFCATSAAVGPDVDVAPGPQKVALEAAEIAIEADLAFFNSNGTVPATVTNVETLMNAVTMIYEQDVSITYLVTAIVVQTGPNENYPSTNASKLLDQFREYWNDNLGQIDRDTAHLLHGKSLSSNIAGLAYVGVVCVESVAYGWSRTTITGLFAFRVAITAHELGHNWNAKHCDGDADCEIMCSVIGSTGSCTGGTSSLGQKAQKKIGKWLDDAGCVSELPDPLTPPFHDPFSKLVDSNWLIRNGAKTTKKAIGETSGEKSVGLDLGDELRSNKIDLSGLAQARVELFVAARGPEEGEALVVEGLRDTAVWTELLRIEADGTTDDSFAFFGVDLPANNLHADFQLRLRPEVDEKNDDFYVDDVRVFDPGAGQDPSLRAAAVDPIVVSWPLSIAGMPAAQTISVQNDGRSTANLPWTAAELVPEPWIAITPSSGTVLANEDADTISVQLDPNGLGFARYPAVIRLTNGVDGADTVDAPVAFIVHIGTYVNLGDSMTGTVEISGETDLFSFSGAAGQKVKLTVETTSGDLKPRLAVADAFGFPIATLDFKGKKPQTKKVTLPIDGFYVVEIGAKNPDQTGDYEIKTKRVDPKEGKLDVSRRKPSTSGGSIDLPVTLTDGSSLSVTVVPVVDGDGPFAITVDDHDGQPIDVTAFIRALPTGGVALHRLPIVFPGTVMVHITGFVGKEKVDVTIDPGAPAKGEETHVVP